MPDTACKAVLRFPSLRFFSFFCCMFAELAWAFTFLKVSTSPAPCLQLPECGTSHRPETSGLAPAVGRGRGDFVHRKRPSSGNFLWPFLTDEPPPRRLHALPEPETRAWRERPAPSRTRVGGSRAPRAPPPQVPPPRARMLDSIPTPGPAFP